MYIVQHYPLLSIYIVLYLKRYILMEFTLFCVWYFFSCYHRRSWKSFRNSSSYALRQITTRSWENTCINKCSTIRDAFHILVSNNNSLCICLKKQQTFNFLSKLKLIVVTLHLHFNFVNVILYLHPRFPFFIFLYAYIIVLIKMFCLYLSIYHEIFFPTVPFLSELLKIDLEQPGPDICNLRRVTMMMKPIKVIQSYQKSNYGK